MDNNKKAQSLYTLFLFLVVFWTFLLIFSSVFSTVLFYDQFKDDPYLVNTPAAFYTRMATFQYFNDYPIPTIVFDSIIILTGVVSYMLLHPLKGG